MNANQTAVEPDNITCLRVISRSGRVDVFAEGREDFLLAGEHTIAEVIDGTLVVSSDHGSSTIGVRCPLGTNMIIGTGSGRIAVSGHVGDIRATSASGTVLVESARAADLRSESGNVSIGTCGDRCRVQTASGSVQAGSLATAEVATLSGKVSVANASGAARVRTATGQVDLATNGESDVAIETMSGAVTVRLPAGTRPAASLYAVKGDTSCELSSGTDCKVAVRSMNGKIKVVCA
ncbi:MAG: DUF4097 family beta strand repeat-containing protein [Anaerolineaceae bacterium]